MNRILTGLLLLALSPILQAKTIPLQSVKVDISNQARLQRGAKLFMNYCSGCHSLRYMRYSQVAKGLGLLRFDGQLDKDLLFNNLIFTSATEHDPIEISMPEIDARKWFGIVPPDLSLSVRLHGTDWIYTYLQSFYRDKKRPFGANNLLVPDVAMPNVLAPLQGNMVAMNLDELQEKTFDLEYIMVDAGLMSQQEFASALQDLVTFLAYVAEPQKQMSHRIGVGVLIFLLILAFFAYRLKKNYWRDVH